MKAEHKIVIQDWGLIDYSQAYEKQKSLVAQVIAGAPAQLVFCEHPAVLTLGRMTKPENLLWTKEMIQSQGVALLPVDRGGDVTLHAPGQLIIYPIVNLALFGRDLKKFLEELEEVVIDLLKDFDILAGSIDGQRGVWVGQNKIASMGIGVRKWVTYHGIGLNVNTDLTLFRMIRPCGLDVQMTSLQKHQGRLIGIGEVKQSFLKYFCLRFKFNQVL